MYDKIVIEKPREKYGNQRNVYITLHLKIYYEWNAQLAKGTLTSFIVCDEDC